MKKDWVRSSVPRLLAACTAALLCGTVAANPTGATVVNGQVTFNANGNTLTVINTPGSIINWQGFSISAGELTRFMQQSASSAVLNRIVGIDPSIILGALQSNGRVFLVNPNGISFGAGSQVEVGGLVASTLNITDPNFLAGTHSYTAAVQAGSIAAGGAIAAQNGVYLIAPNITISGVITSTQGSVVLAAGQTVGIAESSAGNANSASVTENGSETISLPGSVIAGGNIIVQGGAIAGGNIINVGAPIIGNGSICVVSFGSGCGSISASPVITASGGNISLSTTGSPTNIDGNVYLNFPGSALASAGGSGLGASGGVITLAGSAGTGNNSQPPQFVFGDTSTLKVVETRDAAGNITGWSLASQ